MKVFVCLMLALLKMASSQSGSGSGSGLECRDTMEPAGSCAEYKKFTEGDQIPWAWSCRHDSSVIEGCKASCGLCDGDPFEGQCIDLDVEWCLNRQRCMSTAEFFLSRCIGDQVLYETCPSACFLCEGVKPCIDYDPAGCAKAKQDILDDTTKSFVYECRHDPFLQEICPVTCDRCGLIEGSGSGLSGSGSSEICEPDRDPEFCAKKLDCESAAGFHTFACVHDPVTMEMCQSTCQIGPCEGFFGDCVDKDSAFCVEESLWYYDHGRSFVYECQEPGAAHLISPVCRQTCGLCTVGGITNPPGFCEDKDPTYCANIMANVNFLNETCVTDAAAIAVCQLTCNACPPVGSGSGSGSGMGLGSGMGSGSGMGCGSGDKK